MKRSLTTRSNLAHLLIKAACENVGFEYREVSQNGKTCFTFPDQVYCPAMDVLRFASSCARSKPAANAIAKQVRLAKIKETAQ